VALTEHVLMMSDVSWNGRLHHTRVKGVYALYVCLAKQDASTVCNGLSAEQLAQVVVLGLHRALRACAQSLLITWGSKLELTSPKLVHLVLSAPHSLGTRACMQVVLPLL
jgi:hypothetical protein